MSMQTPVWLDEEAKMSLGRCRTCKYVGYCNSQENTVATECEKYENLDSAPAFEWNLKDLMKLWSKVDEKIPQE